MIKKTFVIRNKFGIHARPASLLAKTANKFKSKVMLIKNSQEADCKSILGILMLAIEHGSNIDIVTSGIDEKEVMAKIEVLIKNKFFRE